MEVLQPMQPINLAAVRQPYWSVRMGRPRVERQPSSPREEWWSSYESEGDSAAVLAGSPFGPLMGGCFKGSGSALASLWSGGARWQSSCFVLLARPNHALKSFVALLLTRTSDTPRRFVPSATRYCGHKSPLRLGRRLAWRYV